MDTEELKDTIQKMEESAGIPHVVPMTEDTFNHIIREQPVDNGWNQEPTETEKIIKNFLTEMANQDNRATAFPYYYVIKTKIKGPAYEGCGDETEYRWNDESYDSMEELEKYWVDNNYTEEDIGKARRDVEEYEYKYDWVSKGMFLTEKDAEDHLRRNHYHYSKDAHTYIEHAWRAPWMGEFFIALFKYFYIPKGNLDF